MLISACGQYGDLYAPSEEDVQEGTVAEEVEVEDKDKQ